MTKELQHPAPRRLRHGHFSEGLERRVLTLVRRAGTRRRR